MLPQTQDMNRQRCDLRSCFSKGAKLAKCRQSDSSTVLPAFCSKSPSSCFAIRSECAVKEAQLPPKKTRKSISATSFIWLRRRSFSFSGPRGRFCNTIVRSTYGNIPWSLYAMSTSLCKPWDSPQNSVTLPRKEGL